MKRLFPILTAALALSGCIIVSNEGGERTVVTAEAPNAGLSAAYAAAIADPLRPAEERERDPLRHPAEMLAFAELSPGDRIADIRPGAGYFTRLFARVVGPQGHVYAFVPDQTAARENARAQPLVDAYGNVSLVNGRLETMRFDQPLDVIFVSQEYHDFHLPFFGPADIAQVNASAFRALRPGGLYVLIDHQARPGSGISDTAQLHRMEGAQLRREVEAAGFVFDGESTAVANPADDHSLNVFDPAIRGRTDQFVYRFRKPG